MSRILRRPMFRGGRVDGRGTGITSGLGYEKGGRVGYEPGGSVTGGDIMSRLSNFFTKPALGPDGKPIPFQTRNIVDDAAFLIGPGKFVKAGGGGLNLIRQMGKQPLFPPGYKAGFKKGMKSGEPEAAPFLSNKYFKDLISPYTSGMKELTKEAVGTVKDYGIPFGIGSLGAGFGLKKGYDAFMSKDEDSKNEIDAALSEAEEKAKRDKEFAEYMEKLASNKIEEIKSDIGGKEQIDIDKAIFADALGKKKARIEDASNMALGFAGRAFEEGATTKSALGKFFADEAKRPSAATKIDQAAGSAAINKYIKGEISKAELDKFFAQTDYKMSFASKKGKKNIANNIIEAARSFGRGYKSVDYGLRMSFDNTQTNKMDASEGQTIDKVPLTVDNIGQIFIEDEAPYRAVMITIEEGQLIRDPLN